MLRNYFDKNNFSWKFREHFNKMENIRESSRIYLKIENKIEIVKVQVTIEIDCHEKLLVESSRLPSLLGMKKNFHCSRMTAGEFCFGKS